MKKEDAVKQSTVGDGWGFAYRDSSNPAMCYYWHGDSGRAWVSLNRELQERTRSGIDRMPTHGWKPGLPNEFWRRKIAAQFQQKELPLKPGLLQLLAKARGYKDLIVSLGNEIESTRIGDDLRKPLAELAKAIRSLDEML